MATFVKGLTDQLGPMQLYKPDYQFLTQVYGTKQAEYDRGFNMVKNLYNSVLNGPVTNQENANFRNEAFKKLQNSLKSVSNLDLSNPTNILKAQSMIAPITQDKDLAYDMAVTSFHQKQKQVMENYKNSNDPKMRALYSDLSAMDIQFAENDLKSAKRGDGSIQTIAPREFTPFEDVMEYLRKAAKEQKLEIVRSGPNGKGYILKRTNGPDAAPAFSEWAYATMGTRFDRQLQVTGRVNAESKIRSLMESTGISRQDAVNQLSRQLLPKIQEKESLKGVKSERKVKQIDNDIKYYETQYPNGFPPNKPEIQKAYNDLLQQRDDYKNKHDEARMNVGRMQEEGENYVAGNLHNIFYQEAKSQTAKNFGALAATVNQSEEVRPDQVVLTQWNIGSRERIAAANLAQRRAELDFRKQAHQDNLALKTAVAKSKGQLATEEVIGSGVSNEPLFGSDAVSEGMSENRTKVHSLAFNGADGLIKAVVHDPKQFTNVLAVMNKIQGMAAGSNQKLTADEMKTLQGYGDLLNVDISNPGNQVDAVSLLDALASSTYKAASNNIALYRKNGKLSQMSGVVKNFQQMQGTFMQLTAERTNYNNNMSRLSKEVMNPDGTIKPLYKGAKIRSRLADGTYDLDLNGVSPAAKTRLGNLVDQDFNQRTAPVTNNYQFNNLSAGEMHAIFRNPYNRSSITSSDGTKISEEALSNLNTADMKILFGNNVSVFYDAGKKVARVTANISQQKGLAKKLGIEQPGNVTVEIPYATLKADRGAMTRLVKYMGANQPDMASMGHLGSLYNNPGTKVTAPSYMANSGFDFTLVGSKNANGQSVAMINFEFYNPQTKRNEMRQQQVPFNPADPASIRDLNEMLNRTYQNYLNDSYSFED